ncbi:MAG: hypothetical protein GVY21_02875 [Gammaproteobacteria bacterium]|jgi:uncharacterized membrane protein SirB2|nr:hypothetical protein [Gammaproteobacteria bacterium]
MIIKSLHIALAYLTVAGFIIRGVWAITDSPLRDERWVKTAPHVVDTLLLSLGAVLAFRLGVSPLSGWLAAKLLGLLAYVGFGVVTMRGRSKAVQMVGFAGALIAVLYIFAVALSRSPWPL